MYISENSWHFKLYKFTKIVVERFKGNPYWEDAVEGRSAKVINLCPYMRTILIWGPIVLALYGMMYAFGIYVLLYLPIMMTNTAALINTGLFVLTTGTIGAIFIGAFAGASYLSDKAIKHRREKLERMEAEGIKPTGFFVILGEYLKSLKSKTCIQLEVK